ncbi:hypothetical protein ACA910_018993 [Epithemia clementina (nom. ined.)]
MGNCFSSTHPSPLPSPSSSSSLPQKQQQQQQQHQQHQPHQQQQQHKQKQKPQRQTNHYTQKAAQQQKGQQGNGTNAAVPNNNNRILEETKSHKKTAAGKASTPPPKQKQALLLLDVLPDLKSGAVLQGDVTESTIDSESPPRNQTQNHDLDENSLLDTTLPLTPLSALSSSSSSPSRATSPITPPTREEQLSKQQGLPRRPSSSSSTASQQPPDSPRRRRQSQEQHRQQQQQQQEQPHDFEDEESLNDDFWFRKRAADTSSGADQPIHWSPTNSSHNSSRTTTTTTTTERRLSSSSPRHPQPQQEEQQPHSVRSPPQQSSSSISIGSNNNNNNNNHNQPQPPTSRALQARLRRSQQLQQQHPPQVQLQLRETPPDDNHDMDFGLSIPSIIQTSTPPFSPPRYQKQQQQQQQGFSTSHSSLDADPSFSSFGDHTTISAGAPTWTMSNDSTHSPMVRYHANNHQHHHSPKNHFATTTTPSSSESTKLLRMSNEDFEASLNQSLIWAQMDAASILGKHKNSSTNSAIGTTNNNNTTNHNHQKETVWAVALSRHSTTSSNQGHQHLHSSHSNSLDAAASVTVLLWQTPPPLYLAVGTETGMLCVTQILDETPQLHRPNDIQNNNNSTPQRLGPTSTLQRPGRIRSLDFCPTGVNSNNSSPNTCWLACGGDNGTCALVVVSERVPGGDPPSSQNNTDIGDDDAGPLLQVVAEIPRVDRIYSVQFSPNGLFLAIGGYDETVSIVQTSAEALFTMMSRSSTMNTNAKTKKAQPPRSVAEIPVNGLISTLDWSPDSALLAIGGSDKVCTLVDARVHNNFAILHGIKCPAAVSCLKWHPRGHLLAIGCASQNVFLLDRSTVEFVRELTFGSDGTTSSTVLDPDDPSRHHRHRHRRSNSFGSASNSSGIRINDLCWSPTTGHYLVVCTSGSASSSLSSTKLLETKSYSTIQELPVRITGVINSVVWGQPSSTSMSLIPPKFLAMGGNNGKVLILKAGVDVMMHSNHRALSQSAHSSSYYFGGATTSSALSSIGDESTSGGGGSFSSNWLDSQDVTGKSWILQENSFREMENNDPDELLPSAPDMFAENNVFRNSDGDKNDEPIVPAFHDTLKTRQISTRSPFPTAMQTVAFSRGSKSRRSAFFAVASAEHASVTVRSTGSRHATTSPSPEWHPLCQLDFLDPITCLAFSNGSRILACGSQYNGHVHIVATSPAWIVVNVAKVPGGGVQAMAFSKNNEILAVLGIDGALRLLDPHKDFACCREMVGPQPPRILGMQHVPPDDATTARSTCFDWSSKYLTVGHEDGVVSIYHSLDVLDGCSPSKSMSRKRMEASIVTTQPTPVRSVAIGPSSRFLAVGGDDGILTVLCRNNTSSHPGRPTHSPPPPQPTASGRDTHHEDDARMHNATTTENKQNDGNWIEVHRVSTIDFSIAHIKWSPSGRHIAVMGQNKQLKVVDTVFWAEVEEVTEFTTYDDSNDSDALSWPHRRKMRPIGSVSFSQDGKWMAISEDFDPARSKHDDGDDDNDEGDDKEPGGKIRVFSTLTWDVVLRVPLLADDAASIDGFGDSNEQGQGENVNASTSGYSGTNNNGTNNNNHDENDRNVQTTATNKDGAMTSAIAMAAQR